MENLFNLLFETGEVNFKIKYNDCEPTDEKEFIGHNLLISAGNKKLAIQFADTTDLSVFRSEFIDETCRVILESIKRDEKTKI